MRLFIADIALSHDAVGAQNMLPTELMEKPCVYVKLIGKSMSV